jgi:Ribbon-helix-helix protein, copG family
MPYVLPYVMKKTSVYLDEADVERLRRLAMIEQRSQAEIIREAIQNYEARSDPDRDFELEGAWDGDGTSVAGVPDEELLEGFGT